MVKLPDALQKLAGLEIGATVSDLLECLKTMPWILDGLLTSEEGREAAIMSLENYPKYRMRIEDQIGPWQSKFCMVNAGNHTVPVLVALIAEMRVEDPPTEIENLLFWAIIDSNLKWHESTRDEGGDTVVDWRKLAKGKAIIAEPIEAINQQIISALFGLSHSTMSPVGLPTPLLSSVPAVKVSAQSEGHSAMQARLLFEASTAQHPKWRLLSLYRILENAYLTNIKETLLKEFDFNASKAIDDAKNKLASEVNQLVHLAENVDLATEFMLFNAEVDNLIQNGNRYITMLDRSIKAEALYKAKEPYKKAVLRFYKMRCSIAHAGTSDVIYEQFSDANAAALCLLPSVETIALKSLRITAS